MSFSEAYSRIGLDPTFRGVYREVLHDVKLSAGSLNAKTRVIVDVSKANISVCSFSG